LYFIVYKIWEIVYISSLLHGGVYRGYSVYTMVYKIWEIVYDGIQWYTNRTGLMRVLVG